jgi:hypothetical protein
LEMIYNNTIIARTVNKLAPTKATVDQFPSEVESDVEIERLRDAGSAVPVQLTVSVTVITLTGLMIKGGRVELEAKVSSKREGVAEEEAEAEEVEAVVEAVVEAEVEAVVEAGKKAPEEGVRELEAARNRLEDPATRPGTRLDTGLEIGSLVLLRAFWRKASILSPGLSAKTMPA